MNHNSSKKQKHFLDQLIWVIMTHHIVTVKNCLGAQIPVKWDYSLNKGTFNNYVDKKKGRRGQPKVHICPLRSRGPKFEKNPAFIESILYHCALDLIWILLSLKLQSLLFQNFGSRNSAWKVNKEFLDSIEICLQLFSRELMKWAKIYKFSARSRQSDRNVHFQIGCKFIKLF